MAPMSCSNVADPVETAGETMWWNVGETLLQNRPQWELFGAIGIHGLEMNKSEKHGSLISWKKQRMHGVARRLV
jgi:hypothetical protein